MRITPDTNVLLRFLLGDDVAQSPAAHALLARADEVVLTFVALAELDWVLRKQMRKPRAAVVKAIRGLLRLPNVHYFRWTVEEGLEALEAGADFADGIIAYDGAWQHGDTYATFDQRAASVMRARGSDVLLIA